MSENSVVAIVIGLFGLLASAGFWTYMSNRKEAPIKKRDADIAAAHTSQQMAIANAEELRKDVNRIRGDLDHERTQREELGTKFEALQKKVDEQADTISSLRRVIRIFNDAWASLEANWQILRLQETAPRKPYIDMKEEAL
jgi:peptidoglycan hydrolase CwlO-like protein